MCKKIFFSGIACIIASFLAAGCVNHSRENRSSSEKSAGGDMQDVGLLSRLYLLKDYRSKRASSWRRSGENMDFIVIAPGETYVFLQEEGAGCVKHFYWTYIEEEEQRRLNLFRGSVLRAFWDGADLPSIEVPLGDFFGISHGRIRPIKSLAFTTNPGRYAEPTSRGFNCYLPMPFAKGARIELENQNQEDVQLWFHIDYDLYEEASAIPENAGRLHTLWNRVNPTKAIRNPVNLTGKDNYTILDVEGSGQFVGYFLTVVNLRPGWWGEGDDMVFIDGESFPPSIHGTGSEEIFGGGACPTTEYSGPYTGFHCIENKLGMTFLGINGMYRFYLTDALRFHKSIRVSIEHGTGNNKSNDYSSVAFWYQQRVNKERPPLPPISEREVLKLLPLPKSHIRDRVFVDKTEVVLDYPVKYSMLKERLIEDNDLLLPLSNRSKWSRGANRGQLRLVI